MERGLDPLTTNLVVADESRTEKTICLAVSPSLKSFGIPGRPRLFEVVEKVNKANEIRLHRNNLRGFSGESCDINELNHDGRLKISYITARPRMKYYMDYSARIYKVYLKYVAPEDIHVYSVDEVMIDATRYLKNYNRTAKELTKAMILDVLNETGVTATAGIGTNLYLCKVAMDILAKKESPDEDGVRIAILDEMSYRKRLWNHRPITDFWRIGRGYAKKLAEHGMYTMGDVARCSLGAPGQIHNEDLLYKIFGINAELLIDHAWGFEPCTMRDIKSYRAQNHSVSSGQVLNRPYSHEEAGLIVKEMAELLSLDLVDKGLKTNQIVLTVGYDIENLSDSGIKNLYKGEVTIDRYGRKVPKHAHGTKNLKNYTSSSRIIRDSVINLFENIVNPILSVRRVNLAANHVREEGAEEDGFKQLDLFSDFLKPPDLETPRTCPDEREKRLQMAVLALKKRYGSNIVIKGMNLEKSATTRERNAQIGGHKA